jgi:hypothetical protein
MRRQCCLPMTEYAEASVQGNPKEIWAKQQFASHRSGHPGKPISPCGMVGKGIVATVVRVDQRPVPLHRDATHCIRESRCA